MWQRGYTGKGIGVALIDTGVVPVTGLTSGNVVNGPDLSFESQSSRYRYLDTFGHGTHMAGIIAGRDKAGAPTAGQFRGIAPDVEADQRQDRDERRRRRRLAGRRRRGLGGRAPQRRQGQPDPGAQPLLRHRRDPGLPRRPADPRLGERVARRDRGRGRGRQPGPRRQAGQPGLRPPRHRRRRGRRRAARPPSPPTTRCPTSPAAATRTRRVDLTAPGRSIVSLRDPGSYIDAAHAAARYQDRFFKGSGSSQAAAVVSGAVALLLDQRPDLTPTRSRRCCAAPPRRCRWPTRPDGVPARSTSPRRAWPRRPPAPRRRRDPPAPVASKRPRHAARRRR